MFSPISVGSATFDMFLEMLQVLKDPEQVEKALEAMAKAAKDREVAQFEAAETRRQASDALSRVDALKGEVESLERHRSGLVERNDALEESFAKRGFEIAAALEKAKEDLESAKAKMKEDFETEKSVVQRQIEQLHIEREAAVLELKRVGGEVEEAQNSLDKLNEIFAKGAKK